MTVALNAESYGKEGPQALVVLHGLFGSSTNWRAIAKRLATTRPVHTLDLRNHGASPHSESMTYEEMAQDVRAWIDAHQLIEPVIVGHSMGGKIAMKLALEHREVIGALVVVDIAPVARNGDVDQLLRAMKALPVATSSGRAALDEALSEQVPEPALRAFLLQNLNRDAEGFRWRINLDAIEHNLSSILGFDIELETDRYVGPTLFIRGAQSQYVNASHQETIDKLFPNVKIETIADAGHWVHAEKPIEFIDALERFLTV